MAVSSDKPMEDSAQSAKQQQGDSSWPIPGDEGYVNPDGTPGSYEQLERNKRAAADRAAAGSSVHGAPAATPGPQLAEQAAAAVERAEAKSAVTDEDREKGLTEYIEKNYAAAAEKANVDDATADASKRTATTDGDKTTR